MGRRPAVAGPTVAERNEEVLRSLPEGIRQHVVRGLSEGGLIFYFAPVSAAAKRRCPLGTWVILPPWFLLVGGGAGALATMGYLGMLDGVGKGAKGLWAQFGPRQKAAQSAREKLAKGETPTQAEADALTAEAVNTAGNASNPVTAILDFFGVI